LSVGAAVGFLVGIAVGFCEGDGVGSLVGATVGFFEGAAVGSLVVGLGDVGVFAAGVCIRWHSQLAHIHMLLELEIQSEHLLCLQASSTLEHILHHRRGGGDFYLRPS
jgi:hypothetical protein